MKICQRLRYFPKRGGLKALWVVFETKPKIRWGYMHSLYIEEHSNRPQELEKITSIPGCDIIYEDYRGWIETAKALQVLKA